MLAQTEALGWLEPWLVRLGDTAPTGGAGVVGALLAALVIGAAHALAPGHGKMFAAAMLASGRARAADALLLGMSVAAMHTTSVLVLGVALYATRRSVPDLGALAPAMTAASGLLVAVVGAALLTHRLRRRGRPHTHALVGPPAPAADTHGESVPTRGTVSRPGVLTVGAAGGLLPSPSAFLVLATSIFAGYVWFGLALVAAFGIGLAGTVTAVGVAALRGRAVIDHLARERPRFARAAALLPLLSAALLLVGGLAVAGVALL